MIYCKTILLINNMIWSDHECLKPFSTIFPLNRGGSDGIEINNRLLNMTCTCTCKIHVLVFIVLMKLSKVEFSTTFFSARKGNINILTLEKTETAINNGPSREQSMLSTRLRRIFYSKYSIKMKNKTYHTVGTIPISNINIVERGKIDTLTHKYMTSNTQIHDP